MFRDDWGYYQHRAEVEMKRAEQATLTTVARAHYQLAEAYLDKLASAQRPMAEAP